MGESLVGGGESGNGIFHANGLCRVGEGAPGIGTGCVPFHVDANVACLVPVGDLDHGFIDRLEDEVVCAVAVYACSGHLSDDLCG